MRGPIRCAFSLIELLVVIAVIALLAALLFPVFARAREQARLTSCESNMQQISTALHLYETDYGAYPNLLLGYAENPDGSPYAGSGTPVAADQLVHSVLMKYLKNDVSVFHCPDDTTKDRTLTTTAVFPPSSGYQPSPVTPASLGYANLPNTPVYLYKYDSYDITPLVDASGQTNGAFQFVYSKQWSGKASGLSDAPNQLKYLNPPPDRTVVTWCNYHVAIAKGEKSPVLLLSGTVKPLDFKKMVQYGWNVGAQ